MATSDPAYPSHSRVPPPPPVIDRFASIGLGPALSELRALARWPSSVVVGIVDGPVATGISALRDADLRVAPGHENRPFAAGAATRHGTHIASILFAREGLIPECRGLLAPVVGERDDGAVVSADQFMLARAIEMLVEAGATIINVSAGQRVAYPDADVVLRRALELCAERDVLIVAAAGNDGCACADLPAALPPVLAVGSHDVAGMPSAFSNFADAYLGSGLLAPGEDVWGLDPSGAEITATGTSYSAAIVSGVAALLMSASATQGRAAGGRAILNAMLKSAAACAAGERVTGAACLAGRLDIAGAMTELNLLRAEQRPMFFSGRRGAMTSAEGVSLQGVSEIPAAVSGGPTDTPPIEVTSPPPGLTPSDCGCGCGGVAKAESKPAASADCGCGRQAAPQLAYAFGSLDVDFGTEARRDVFVQAMHQQMGTRATPADPEQLAQFLDKSPEYEQGLTWIIRLDAAPVYAVRPVGTYAQSTAEKLRTLFHAFANTKKGEEEIQLASFPGYVHGRARLISGLEVPVIYPDSRGIFGWRVRDLAKSVGKDNEASAAVENFLNRIYFEFRNLGLMPKDRALNYAATNAFQVGGVFSKALADKMVLDTISVQKSPICRPEADCWDVVLTFFKPEDKFSQARMSHRFTVDVSDVLPVLVGPVRSWAVY